MWSPRLLLIGLLLATGLAYGADLEDAENCLANGKPHASRQYLTQQGIEVPVGFWIQNWTSCRLATDVARILIQEVLGVHTAVTGAGSSSTAGLYATAGCAEPNLHATKQRACSIESHARSPHHVSFEIWGVAKIGVMEGRLASIPTTIPINAGPMGYVGADGLYVFEEIRRAAYEATGATLDFYRDWNRSHFEAWQYFDRMSDVDPSLLKPCAITSLKDQDEMANYVRWTGDEGGIIRDADENVVSGNCWNGSWWVSPACRDNLDLCVPSITGGGSGWGLLDSMQYLAVHNMPIALAVASSSALWGQLGKSVRGVHYWYTPDDTFIAEMPHNIVLPPYNLELQRQGYRATAPDTTPLNKFVWNRLNDANPGVDAFIHRFSLGSTQLEGMMAAVPKSSAATLKEKEREVACNWLRANEQTWQRWIPDLRECQAGFGIVDATGDPVSSIDDATRCEFCLPGWYSSPTNAENTRTCIRCEAGTSQELPAQTECISCANGYFAAQEGKSSCEICGEGFFQNTTGASDCHRCPDDSTTRLLGAASFSDCVCPRGMYEAFEETARSTGIVPCRPCPGGMSCEIDSREVWLLSEANVLQTEQMIGKNRNYPRLMEGYMTRTSEPLKVFKCITEGACPGGGPGRCASRRDSETIACGDCESEAYESVSKECKECSAVQVVVLFVVAPIAAVVGLVGLSWAANKERISEINASASCAIIAGLTASSIQTMSVLNNLEVEWIEPLKSVLSALLLLGFDVRIINAGCLFDGGVGTFVLRQLLAPGLSLGLLLIGVIKKWLHPRAVDVSVHVCNSVGSLFLLFFTAIVLSAITPYVCYKHPDGNGESMLSDAAILCFEGGKHDTMLVVGLLSLLLVCLPFFIFVVVISIIYPRIVVNSNTAHFRRIFFLFRRFKPEAYYFGVAILSRGLLVCLVPVMLRDKAAAQVLLFAAILATFTFAQGMIRPWRGTVVNALDMCITLSMVLLLMGAALTTSPSDAKASVSAFSHVALIFMLLALIAGICYALYNRWVPHPFYSHFVCHHKAGAAAQARLLQLLLQRKSQQLCFIDSDNLTNLDELFDVVRSKVGTLLVYLTSDVLTRPWCVGEITTAYKAGVSTMRVLTKSFDSSRSQDEDQLAEAMDGDFLEAGILIPDVQAALSWLLSSTVPQVALNEASLGTMKLAAAADEILRAKSSSPTPWRSIRENASVTGSALDNDVARLTSRGVENGSVVISCHSSDDEAMAIAGIIAYLLQDWAMSHTGNAMAPMCDLPSLSDGNVNFKGLKDVMSPGCATVVVLTEGSLTSPLQLSSIIAALELVRSGAHLDVLPVQTPNFRFPDDIYYSTTLAQVLESGLDPGHAADMLQQLFRRISVHFTASASRVILETEADQMQKRLSLDGKRRANSEEPQRTLPTKREQKPNVLSPSGVSLGFDPTPSKNSAEKLVADIPVGKEASDSNPQGTEFALEC